MKEVKLFMNDSRSLSIVDEKGTEYGFEPISWGIPVSFSIKTKQEEWEESERCRKAREEETKRYFEDAALKKRKWYHIF
jgi:hypothetical protein